MDKGFDSSASLEDVTLVCNHFQMVPREIMHHFNCASIKAIANLLRSQKEKRTEEIDCTPTLNEPSWRADFGGFTMTRKTETLRSIVTRELSEEMRRIAEQQNRRINREIWDSIEPEFDAAKLRAEEPKKKKKRKWIGIDLDGCVARDVPMEKFDPSVIGTPIPAMVRLIKEHMEERYEVRIFTARASTIDHHTVHDGSPEEFRQDVVSAIKKWCVEHIGVELEVTCEKDYLMHILYDDRARQVIKDKGVVVGCSRCAI